MKSKVTVIFDTYSDPINEFIRANANNMCAFIYGNFHVGDFFVV